MTSTGSTTNIPPVTNFFPGVILLVDVIFAIAPVTLAHKSLSFASKIWRAQIMLNKSLQEKF
jgi:hypothetical protein